MRKLVIGLVILNLVALGYVFTYKSVKAEVCPVGTYNINTESEPVCKEEPTGCPYADSADKDVCDKLAKQQAPAPVKTVKEQPKKVEHRCE